MKNLISRVKKLEYQERVVFILYFYPYQATQEQAKEAQALAESQYIAEGGDPDLPKTFVGIREFSRPSKASKWFYVS